MKVRKFIDLVRGEIQRGWDGGSYERSETSKSQPLSNPTSNFTGTATGLVGPNSQVTLLMVFGKKQLIISSILFPQTPPSLFAFCTSPLLQSQTEVPWQCPCSWIASGYKRPDPRARGSVCSADHARCSSLNDSQCNVSPAYLKFPKWKQCLEICLKLVMLEFPLLSSLSCHCAAKMPWFLNMCQDYEF